MKRILTIVIAMTLFQIVNAQNTMQVYYAYKNYTLTATNAKIEDKQISYRDSIDVQFYIKPNIAPKLSAGGFKGFDFTINNDTDKLCEVILDDCFIIYDGTSIPVADAHMLRINTDQSSGFVIAPPRSKANKELYQKVKNESDILQLITAKTLVFYITYRFKGDNQTQSISINCTIERVKK